MTSRWSNWYAHPLIVLSTFSRSCRMAGNISGPVKRYEVLPLVLWFCGGGIA
jgi:hypothetical protein